MQERARTAPMPIDSPRREEQDREGNPSDSSVPITKPMSGRKWDGEGEKEGRRWDGYKEVLKVNRIAATESYCRGGKSRRRRHWIRRAGAIYSIHGRTNTNLRLDVQTASSLPIPCFFSRLLSPIHDFSLCLSFPPPCPLSSPAASFLPYRSSTVLHFFLSIGRPPSAAEYPVNSSFAIATWTWYTLRVRVHISKENVVFRINETGSVVFRLVKVRSTLNLMANYYPISGGTGICHARPVSSLFLSSSSLLLLLLLVLALDSGPSVQGNLCYAMESISLAAIVTFLRPRGTTFLRQTVALFWKILLTDRCMMRVCSAWIGCFIVGYENWRASCRRFRVKRVRLRDLVSSFQIEYRESLSEILLID